MKTEEIKKRKNYKINKRAIISFIVIVFIIMLASIYFLNKSEKVIGKIYFDKPVTWENVYVYVADESGENEILGNWPGKILTNKKDYIYYSDITNKMKLSDKSKVIFNDGENYKIETNYSGCDKIYNITQGIGEENNETIGTWKEYDENIKFGKIPQTEGKIKNIIYMIGDGMGENHILAGSIYKGEKLNIQKIEDNCYVKTSSAMTITDSAASATALATGYKTINGTIGKDRHGNDVENLTEFVKSKNLKTGIVCTQILNHATPAGFSVHNINRNNYEEIAYAQVNSSVDLMLGGGKKYFSSYQEEMTKNNYEWINKIDELDNIDKTKKVIGTFAEESISKEMQRVTLADMTNKALSRLENDNGFFLMVEGSDIDTYSHNSDIDNMLKEMIDFDNAVKVAMEYVDNNEETLLIVTADHETGGLMLDNTIINKEQLTNELYTSNGAHTQKNVLLYAYGNSAKDITNYDVIDNTSICKFVKQGLSNYYGE